MPSPNVSPVVRFSPIEQNYGDMALLGNGSYGFVFIAEDLANEGKYVALKKIGVPIEDEGVPLTMIREISLLKKLTQLEHPNVVKLLDVCHGQTLEDEQRVLMYLVFELVDQDLYTYIRNRSVNFELETIKNITKQLLTGLDFLHSNQIVHRDMKPQNVLISNDGCVKLADFGWARSFSSNIALSSKVITSWYRPPEVLLSQSYGSAVDVWSCGCILAELYLRHPLFPGRSDAHQLIKIFSVIGCPSQAEWPENSPFSWERFNSHTGVNISVVIPELCADGVDLLKKLLCYNPLERISCKSALQHPYFLY